MKKILILLTAICFSLLVWNVPLFSSVQKKISTSTSNIADHTGTKIEKYSTPVCPTSQQKCTFSENNQKIEVVNTKASQTQCTLVKNCYRQHVFISQTGCPTHNIQNVSDEEAGTGIQVYAVGFLPNTKYAFSMTAGWEGVETIVVNTCTGEKLSANTQNQQYSLTTPDNFFISSDGSQLVVLTKASVFGNSHNGLYLYDLNKNSYLKPITQSQDIEKNQPYPEQNFSISDVQFSNNALTWQQSNKSEKQSFSF